MPQRAGSRATFQSLPFDARPGTRIRGAATAGPSPCQRRLQLTRDPADGRAERAGGQERVGRLGEYAAEHPAPGHGDAGVDLAAVVDGRGEVLDVEADRADRAQHQTTALRLVHLDLELERPPRQRALHLNVVAGDQSLAP